MKPKHVNPEHVICFDCDDTLVMWGEGPNDVVIKNPYNEQEIFNLKKHERHIRLLKDNFARGYFVTVWSAGGYLWAKAVVKALGLEEYVHHITAKPSAYVDDLHANEVLVNRIYLEDK